MRSIHFRVEDDVYMRIQEEAEQQDLSIASFARVATVARTLRRIKPDAQQNRKVLDRSGQVFEPAQRGTVGPVRIVDCNKEPLGKRQVRERPLQAVKRGA